MESYEELMKQKAELEQKIVEAKKRERADPRMKVKELCKEFGFTAGMLKGSLAEGRKKR